MYRTNWLIEITPVEVVRETEKMIVYLGADNRERKTLKNSSYDAYHETYEDAFKFIKNRLEKKVISEKEDFERAEARLAEFLLTKKV